MPVEKEQYLSGKRDKHTITEYLIICIADIIAHHCENLEAGGEIVIVVPPLIFFARVGPGRAPSVITILLATCRFNIFPVIGTFVSEPGPGNRFSHFQQVRVITEEWFHQIEISTGQ